MTTASRDRAAALSGLVFLLGSIVARAADIPRAERRSGYETMAPETRAMQDDDDANPGMFWVLEGESLWGDKAGAAQTSCADCHGDATRSMKAVSTRYPAFDDAQGRAIDIEDRINLCRRDKQGVESLPRESRALLALTAYIARQSRGEPITVGDDPRLGPAINSGRSLFENRRGQLNLSCAQCHDDNWGRRLGGASIPQGQPNGYPLYRLEWQAVGSLKRRIRNCLSGMRAAAFSAASNDDVDLEAFLMDRARGMKAEAPAVRP